MSNMQHGGYRRPNNPAAVSGPGSLSKRTDGGPADTRQPVRDVGGFEYGGRQEFRDIQGSAPMNDSTTSPVPFTPLTAASTRPDEPVTSGAALGPGEGPLPMKKQSVSEKLARVAQYDETGEMGYLVSILLAKGM